jgi:hypothetical protein
MPQAPLTATVMREPEVSGNAKQPERLETRKAERPAREIHGDTIVLPTVKVNDGVVVGTPRVTFTSLDSLFYNRLFTGVSLSADQELAARLLLSKLLELQVQQDRAAAIAGTQGTVARIQLSHERDSLLLALLSNDADRDLLASRLTTVPTGGGRRGRSGNGAQVEVPVGAMGGPRSGGRGRVSGSGATLQEVPVTAVFDDVLFNVLFNGIPLSAEQVATARSVLTTYRQKVATTIPEPMPWQLKLEGTADVVMQPASRDALLAILSNDSDRAVVDSRIVTEVRVVNRQPPPKG